MSVRRKIGQSPVISAGVLVFRVFLLLDACQEN